MATIARDGAIRIRDRLKDVIETWGEWICALTFEAVRETLAAAVSDRRISRLALADAVICVDALPRTALGKIDKKAIRESLADDAVSGGRP
ncbi:hypothetical protein [Sphingomonas immobilis]|uniref:AMP-binding enzyme C-terminal domain-containing protein n=1 Tax=Sphingomonas immobilis TaxID=3063997 RepID=A0ABT9A0Q7_9SPHN|nr:hypothetical protein [Sphingomonas sp. CA1-15]MDO7843416.1 hypothetical protein [Sphingomonas sp. CA1-15]